MEIHAKKRELLGKKVKKIRNSGEIPAELFGHGFKNEHLAVNEKEFKKIFKDAGENTIVTLIVDGKEKIPVLISGVDIHYISSKTLSVNFYKIKKGEKIKTKVPINFIGTDNAAKAGFLLMKVLDEIEIEALPEEIPHSFEIDMTNLTEVGQSISVADIKHKESVKIHTPPDTIIVTITEKTKEEVVAPPQAEESEEKQTEDKTEIKEEKK